MLETGYKLITTIANLAKFGLGSSSSLERAFRIDVGLNRTFICPGAARVYELLENMET